MKRWQKKKHVLRCTRHLGEAIIFEMENENVPCSRITLADVFDSLGISRRGPNRNSMFAHPELYGWYVEPLSNNKCKRRHYPMRRG